MELPTVKQNSRDDVSRTIIIFRDSVWKCLAIQKLISQDTVANKDYAKQRWDTH